MVSLAGSGAQSSAVQDGRIVRDDAARLAGRRHHAQHQHQTSTAGVSADMCLPHAAVSLMCAPMPLVNALGTAAESDATLVAPTPAGRYTAVISRARCDDPRWRDAWQPLN